MARRVVGERKGQQLFDMLLVGDPKPIKLDTLAKHEELPVDYRTLLTTWGPGVAFGTLQFADPTDPAGVFTQWQRRFRLHSRHLIASKVWMWMDEAAAAKATVLASGNGSALVTTYGPTRSLFTVSGTYSERWPTFKDALAGLRGRMQRPALYYSTRGSQRDALLSAIRSKNAKLADALFAVVLEEESIAGMLALALSLVREPDAARFTAYIERAMQEPVKRYESRFTDLAQGLVDNPDNPVAIADLTSHVERFDLLGGVPDPVEIELENAVLANPTDDAARLVLLDHYQERGRTRHAQLVRSYLDVLPPELENRYGLMELAATTCEDIVAKWRDAWAAADPTLDLAPLLAEIETADRTLRRAIVNWIEHDQEGRLADEAAARPLLVLALRSEHAASVARALVKLESKSALAFVWSALIHPQTHRHHEDVEEALALAHHKLGKLSPEKVTEVLSWIDPKNRPHTKVAFSLLQAQAKDDRVFEAALSHFLIGSPYAEKILVKRKSDPRVEEMLWAAFDREEAKVLKNDRNVSYSREYGVLSRFLAKLGHARAEEAYARFQTKARMDRAAANRVDREDM